MKTKRVFAFTLAEVLITLVIIGVIAAITVPVLSANYKSQETVSRLKKAFSTIQQSTYKIALAEGAPVGDFSFMQGDDFFMHSKKILILIKYAIQNRKNVSLIL